MGKPGFVLLAVILWEIWENRELWENWDYLGEPDEGVAEPPQKCKKNRRANTRICPYHVLTFAF